MLNVINTILTKAYVSTCSFAGFANFRDAITKYGKIEADSTVLSVREALINKSSSDSYVDKAFKQVLLRDINRIITSPSDLVIRDISEPYLRETLDKYISLLKEMGIDTPNLDFFVVDSFPAPFDNNDWAAFCPDAEDERKYGIKKGIYFKSNRIRPYYSEILLAHETIHHICGQNHPELFAMGLEEGIAELVGSVYLAGKVLGLNVVKNNFIHTKMNRKANLLWTLYADHVRQAFLLYQKFGIECLVDLMRQGRLHIHETEKRMIMNQKQWYQSTSRVFWNDEINSLLEYLFLGYTPNYIVSPLQMILIENATMGTSLKDIAEITETPINVVQSELSSIAFQTSMFMLDGDKIGYSNVNWYKMGSADNSTPVIRYYGDV